MSAFLALNSPLAQPAHFVGLEVVFLVCAALTLMDARARARAGDRYALFQWLAVWAYGVLMELVAFTFLDNYAHAQFTVQLYHRKLPLYIMCVYPVFLYTGLKLVERWRLPALPEALLAGFAICLLDVPFDLVGVRAGWWTWSDKDPNLAVRWLGVPVTSFEWYLLFGAVWALLSRALRPRLERRGWLAWAIAAPLVGAGIIVLGCVSFIPFHLLKAVGLRDDLFVAAHLVGVSVLALAMRPRAIRRGAEPASPGRGAGGSEPSQGSDSIGALAAVPILLVGWCTVVLMLLSPSSVPSRPLVFALIGATIVGLVRITVLARPLTPAVEDLS